MMTDKELAEHLQSLIDEVPNNLLDDSCVDDLLSDECRKLKNLLDTDTKAFMEYAEQLLMASCEDAYAYKMVFLFLCKECRKDASLVDQAIVYGKQVLLCGFMDAAIIRKLFVLLRKKKFYYQAKSIHDMILALPEPKLYAHADVEKYLKARETEFAKRLKTAKDSVTDTFFTAEEYELLKIKFSNCYAELPEENQSDTSGKGETTIEELFGI